ncbi:MAG: hypothetical protein ABEJ05_00215 [Haloglomus sp.]
MTLDVGAALRRGFSRTFERNGLVLMGVFLVFKLVNTVVGQSLSAATDTVLREMARGVPELSASQFTTGPTPLAVDMPLGVAVVLAIAVAILAEAIFVVAVRTMVSEETETVPREFVRRRLLGATLNGVVGGIVVGFLVVVGLVFLVVPGIFLALSFFFVRQEIAVADKNFVDAMSGSWALTKGDRLELFALAVVVAIAGILAGVVTVPVGLASPAASAVVGDALDAVFTVFGVAVAARAYDQLRSEAGPGAVGPDEVGDVGADDEDDQVYE